MYRIACGVALLLIACSPLRAQNAEIDTLKGKIFDARMAQQTLGEGLKHCAELDGKNFYFRMRNRILDLEEYFRSLENLVKAQAFNPEKRRPWSMQDAKERWEVVKKQGAGRQGEVRGSEESAGTREAAAGIAKELCSLRTQGLELLRNWGTKRAALRLAHREGFTGMAVRERASAAKER